MNNQLLALAFGKLMEACALLQQAVEANVEQPKLDSSNATPAAGTAVAPTAKKEKTSKKVKAAVEAVKAEVKEEIEEENEAEDADDLSIDSDEDDFAGMDDGAPKAPAVTEEFLRTQLVEYAKKHSKEKAYAILGKFGAKKVADVAKENYEKVAKLLESGLV